MQGQSLAALDGHNRCPDGDRADPHENLCSHVAARQALIHTGGVYHEGVAPAGIIEDLDVGRERGQGPEDGDDQADDREKDGSSEDALPPLIEEGKSELTEHDQEGVSVICGVVWT